MMMESRDPAIKLFGMKIPFPVEDEEEDEWSGGDDKSAEKVLIDSALFSFTDREK